MVLGVFWMLVANAASLLGAQAILRRVATGQGPVDLAIFLLLRLTIVSGAVLATGMTGIMTAAGLGVLGGVALACLLAAGIRPAPKDLGWPRFGLLSGVFAAVLLVRLLLQVWFLSPFVPDTLSYHLPKVAEWVQCGAITRETGSDWRSPFPAGFELVEIWWTVFLHHDVLIEMAGLEFLLLAFAAVRALAVQAGFGERGTCLAALLYVLAPGVNLQATACLNDGPVAALWLVSAVLVAGRVHPGLAIMALGLGMGMKPTYAYAIPGLVLLGYLRRREPAIEVPSRRWAAALAVGGLLIGSFWYGRNAVLYGNPIHPVGLRGAVKPWQDEPMQQFGPSLSSLRDNTRHLINSRIYDRDPYSALTQLNAGWGLAAFACGLPGLILGLREDARFRKLASGFLLSLAFVFLMTSPDDWSMRFVLFFPALLALAAARLAETLRPVLYLACASLLIQWAGTIAASELPVGALESSLRQGWRHRHSEIIGEIPASVDPLGCLDGATNSYVLYRPDYSRRVVYLRERTAEGLRDSMDSKGIRVIRSSLAFPLIKECVRRGWLKVLGGRFFERP